LEIGEGILKALSKSRVVDPSEFGTFFDYRRIEEAYKNRVLRTQSMCGGYKTKKAMFRYMDCCFIRVDDNMMRIEPSHHEKMESWGATKKGKDDDVIIPYPNSAEEIGNAFLLALSRCTSSVG
jgi:CDI immunity protein